MNDTPDMKQTLELTYPEDLTNLRNFYIIIKHCLEMVPNENWKITALTSRTVTLECDSITVTIKANDTAENE